MIDHLMQNAHTKLQCSYCGKSMQDKRWMSEFHHEKQYKVSKCECGKEHKIAVDFLSSGHDNWDGKWIKVNEKDDIEKAIKGLDKIVGNH